MAKTKTKHRQKGGVHRLLLKVAMVGAALYLVATLVSGRLQVARMQQNLEDATAKTTQKMEENAALQKLMESGDEDAYIERIAREKLGYVRPEERIFVDMSGQ